MKNISIKLLTFLLLSSPLTTKSQFESNKGYYTTPDQDTIVSIFKDEPQNTLTNRVSFFDSTFNNWIYLSPEQIDEFYIEDGKRYYKSKVVILNGDSTKVFLRQLVDGYLSLYSIDILNKPEFYIENSNGSLIKLDISESMVENHIVVKKKYIGQLKYLMKDKPEIQNKIERVKYNQNQLIQLLETYNQLTNKHYQVYHEKRIVMFNNIQTGGFYTNKKSALSFSYYGEIYNPDLLKYSSFRFGLNYNDVRIYSQLYEAYYYSASGVGSNFVEQYDTIRYNYDEMFQIISLTCSYQYKYKHKICNPYVYAGIALSWYNYIKNADDQLYSEEHKNIIRPSLNFGLGVEREILNSFYVYTELKKEIVNQFNIGLKYSL